LDADILVIAGTASMRSVLTFTAAAIVAGMIIPRYAEQMNAHPQQGVTKPAATAQVSSAEPGSVEVPRDAFGHFSVEGRIDGRALQFTVDTGASVIALTADDAAQLGIHPGTGDYTMVMRTANGIVRAAPTTLDTVEIGDIMVHDVGAVVMPQGALSENLLGMSFLSKLSHFDYSNGKMVLEQ
jgi:aspartyl protease family protein